jgi:TonB family protein
MKSVTAILLLTLGLGLCNLSNWTKKADQSSGTKEETVKARIIELFDLCQTGKNSEAASYMMYRGPDQSRSGKDVLRYENDLEKREVDETCAGINKNREQSSDYEFARFLTQMKGDGSEVAAWEIYFQQGPMKAGTIYAFTLLNDKYVLVDIDSTSEQSQRPSPSSSSNTSSEVPGTVREKVTVAPEMPTGPGRIPPSESTPPPLATPRKPPPIISGGVLNGKATSLPPPAYPAVAKAARASGSVTVQVTVDEEGKVISAHAVSGHPLLQQAAVQAARQAKFSPTKLSGQPVKVTGVVIYRFSAQ